ncbi:MAG: potassium channel protein [Caldilineaceae bacterium]|nr:potassium channel protein [Caldilineaceae bacterium]
MSVFFQWLLSYAQNIFAGNRRILTILLMLVALMGLGSAGYMLIEGWPLLDALFMTVITLSTVGYGQVHPLSITGEYFTIFLIVLGVGGAAYTFSAFTNYIVAGELQGVLRKRRMVRRIQRMRDHYIICGYGRVGRQVTEGLAESGCEIVVIDLDEALTTELEEQEISFISGSATDDNVLQEAGIFRARGLCSCLPSDSNNVFVVLSARALNPEMKIIARSNSLESMPKLRIAGADQVMNPYLITGRRMAAELTAPTVVEFLDVMTRRGDLELRIEEIVVRKGSALDGNTIAGGRVRSDTGVNVLAARHQGGAVETNPDPNFIFYADDVLICLGTPDQLARLAVKAGGRD